MGLFLNILFRYVVFLFEVVGEATIRISQTPLKLIVLLIKGVTFVGNYITFALNTFSRSKIASRPTEKRKKTAKIKKSLAIVNSSFRFPTIPKAAIAFFFGFILSVVVIGIPLSIVIASKSLPNPKMLTERIIPVTTKILDRNGKILYEIYADENRTPVTLADIPPVFKEATLAIEDKDFYHHQGFSPSGIVRAVYSILKNNEIQGGSTITQQLVRSALLSPEVSIERKVKELIISVWAERIYTKDQILEMYFNQVPYGGTAWGAEAAAQNYFGKSIKDVSLAEAALIAGLPAAPSRYSPFGARPELAIERQKEVLRRMVEEQYITPEEREQAEQTQLVFKRPDVGIYAPHFVMYVKDVLSQKYGIHRVEQGGLRVITTLDLDLQQKAQEIVTQEVANLKHLNVGNGAAVITTPKNGEILAMVGSTDYFNIKKDGNVNVALTLQQPGSTIKVVTYAAALQKGFTAASLINDSPITYRAPIGPSYSPVNYDGKFHGLVPLRNALGNSYNVPAVRTLAKIGLTTMIDQARKMGVTSWNDPSQYGLSLTLGGGELTMLEMASIYDTLANNGNEVDISPILVVKDYLGNTIEDNRNKLVKRALPEDVAFIISDILSDNSARANAFGPSSALTIPGAWVPVKTGTSNEKRDNWAIGYTRDFTVTIWVGNNNNAPMNQALTSGITGATPIWRKITDHLLTFYPSSKPTPPSTVVMASCRGKSEYFIQGTEHNACGPIPPQNADPDKIAGGNPQELFSVQAEEPVSNGLPQQTQEALKRMQKEIDKQQEERRNNRKRN